MAHNREKTMKSNIVKNNKTKTRTKENKMWAKCNICEAQGCWICITLKMCQTVQKKIAKGPEIRSDIGHHLKQYKIRKPFVIQRNHKVTFLSTSSGSIMRWAEFLDGSGRYEGTTAYLRRWRMWESTAGGQSCERVCCWSGQPGRKDAAGSG